MNVEVSTDVLNIIQTMKDPEWITSQVYQDLASGYWTEKEYIEKVLLPGHVGWKHAMFASFNKIQQEQDDYIMSPFEVEEGVVQCFKCKSYKVFSISNQTRAADEPMTTISKCTKCNNKWTHN